MSDRAATLDLPDDDLRALFEGALGLAQREIAAAQTGPIYSEPPSAERFERLLDDSRELPQSGESVAELLEACGALLEAGRRTSPAFFGYVLSPASPVGIAADLLASAANQNVTAWRSSPAATEVEHLVLCWLGELVGFTSNASGVLVSGGSHANLTALLVAMHARARSDDDRRTLTAHISSEAHFSSAKAASIIGVTARTAAVDADRRIDLERLRAAIAQDRADGLEPFCIVASAGTTGTGAIDPLDELATLAADEGLWLHVDGAYGAFAANVPGVPADLASLKDADSVAVDPHKWLYAPLEAGCTLVKDPNHLIQTYSSHPVYYNFSNDEEPEARNFYEYGFQNSRGFRALKVWMVLQQAGRRGFIEMIAADIGLAGSLFRLASQHPELEAISHNLSIVTFRYFPPGYPEADLNTLNEALLNDLQRNGEVFLSNAVIDGKYCLRACIVNFRTSEKDIEDIIQIVVRNGRRTIG